MTETNYRKLFTQCVGVLVRPWENIIKNMKFTEVRDLISFFQSAYAYFLYDMIKAGCTTIRQGRQIYNSFPVISSTIRSRSINGKLRTTFTDLYNLITRPYRRGCGRVFDQSRVETFEK